MTKEFPFFMGKGWSNSDVAVDIANHCSIQNRLSYCLKMLDSFDVKTLRRVMKAIPKYSGRRKGELEDVVDAILAHMEDLAAKKADLVRRSQS
ncbi:hypothetical protein B0H10DRAFT_2183880 [Mycena sp. CBHHK59/15]|nr:hypothetical protein B0H10DRAFT_2188637 [Mycena sp. CBHHK59/15]KAJ6630220.1 hypothetical protein B0H10DRAFT_2183880 [Mycena sp. CBHHK59/15]